MGVGYSLFVACCSLLVLSCLLFVVRVVMYACLFVVGCRLLFIACSELLTVSCLSVGCCLMCVGG